MMNLRKAGGFAAIVSAITYVFAIGLYATLMMPMADPGLGIGPYVEFYRDHRAIALAWNFSAYAIHGVSLVVLVLALRGMTSRRFPALSTVAAAFGMLWTSLVFLSGFLNLWGTEAVSAAFASDPDAAETLRRVLAVGTSAIDSSDKFLGALWIAVGSLTAFRSKATARAIAAAGMALGLGVLIVGLVLPITDSTASLAFGLGAIVWWLALGIDMLARKEERWE